MLFRQSEQENSQLRFGEKVEDSKINEIIKIKISDRDQYWSEKLTELERDLNVKHSQQVTLLNEEISGLKKKLEKKSVKFEDDDLIAFKNKKLQKEKEILE